MTNKYDPRDFEADSCLAYIAMQVLCSRERSLIPEILYILKPEQVLQFIKVFSGETIRVPEIEEFSKDLSAALAIYHIVIQGNSWDSFSIKYNRDGNYLRHIKRRVRDWSETISDPEKQFIEQLRLQEQSRNVAKTAARKLVRRVGYE